MTDTPVNTWKLAQNIPEDMSKPQNPLPVTITPGKDGQSDIIEDMDFSFDGYQVVRGEFFVGVPQEKRKIQNRSPAGYSLQKLSL